jgi:hypothetical protein
MADYSWKYLVCSMAITDLADLEMNGSIPDDWKFTLYKGKTFYDEVGSAWRERSEKTVYLSNKNAPSSKQRWLHPDTTIDIWKVQQ